MSIIYQTETSIVNDGTAKIERYVIKVTKLAGIEGDEVIKTFHFPNSRLNSRAIAAMNDELSKNNRNLYLGIGLQAYQYHNYIYFYSSYKLFPLAKWDSIVFHFEGDVKMEFEFSYPNKITKYLATNMLPINDNDFDFLATNRLLKWEMFNKRNDATLFGGFMNQEGNMQYSNEAVGQELFMNMAKQISLVKPKLSLIK